MVDDMLFLIKLDLKSVVETFKGEKCKNVFSVHLKLSLGVRYSHTNNKIIQLPQSFLKLGLPSESSKFLLKYKREETQMDWNYPFDFCGSIYRSHHVQKILTHMLDQYPEKICRPNHFEFFGNKIINEFKIIDDFPCCLCLNFPCLTVVTVNKVQDIYNTPIYLL